MKGAKRPIAIIAAVVATASAAVLSGCGEKGDTAAVVRAFYYGV